MQENPEMLGCWVVDLTDWNVEITYRYGAEPRDDEHCANTLTLYC